MNEFSKSSQEGGGRVEKSTTNAGALGSGNCVKGKAKNPKYTNELVSADLSICKNCKQEYDEHFEKLCPEYDEFGYVMPNRKGIKFEPQTNRGAE